MEERWQRVVELFEATRALPVEHRARFLEEATADDSSLREDVELFANAVQASAVVRPAEESTSEPDTLTSIPTTDEAGRPSPRSNEAGLLAGQRMGAYLLVREIGRGGMGSVYLAVRDDGEFKRRVAVKVLRRGMDVPDLAERFRQERQIVAGLEHEGIARLLDGGTTAEGLLYLVVEYVEGQTLTEFCDQRRLSIRDRLELFRLVCSAVHFAHQNLVVHRDLKPANILVTARGVPKLLDFGIAKLLNPDLSAESVAPTRFDLRAMTPEYASPEQIRGQPVTTATDVYSLGVILYELVSGHSPYRFETRSEHEIARVICEQEPEKPSTAVSQTTEVPRASGGAMRTKRTPDVVSRMREELPLTLRRRLAGDIDNIRKEPQRRYGSAEQFSEDVRRHLDGQPVIARRDTLPYRLSKFVQRNRVATAAGLLTAASLVFGILGIAWQARQTEEARQRAERRFNDVRKLANAFLFEFDDAVKNLPGSTSARELVVRRAQEYLDSLASESADDVALQLELATAYERVSFIQWNRYYANLGDPKSALATQRRARRIREQVVQIDENNLQARTDIARSDHLLGDLFVGMGDAEKGLEHYRRSLSIREKLVDENPRDRSARFDVAVSHQRIGDTLGNPSFSENFGDRAGALSSYEAMQEIFGQLAREYPGDSGLRHSLSIGYEKMGDMMRGAQAWTEALRYYREGLELRSELSQQEPNNSRYQRNLAIAYRKVGETMEATDDTVGAGESYRFAVEIFRELVDSDPADANAREHLSVAEDVLQQFEKKTRQHPNQTLAAVRENASKQFPSTPIVSRDRLFPLFISMR